MTRRAALLLQQAIAAHRAERLAEAASAYRELLTQQPDNAVALHNLGLIDWAEGRNEAALAGFLKALQQAPANTDFASSLCEAARAQGWPMAALAALGDTLRQSQRPPLALYAALAEGLAATGRAESALAQLAPAFKLAERSPESWHNIAYHLHQLGHLDAASTAVAKAIAQTPDTPPALPMRLASLNLQATLLRAQQRGEDARQVLQAASALAPSHAPTWNNLAALRRDIGDFAAADAAARQALALAPDYPQALNTAGTIAFARQEFARARNFYEHALRLQAHFAEAHWNLALACLAQGDFVTGWAEYEWRRRLPQAAHLFADPGLPAWQGEALEGKTLLIYAEQGNGDTLQFIRLAAPLAARGVRLIALVQPGLVRLLARCPFLAEVHAQGGHVPTADFCLPVLSLPYRLDLRPHTIPHPPYLFPPAEEIAAWGKRLAASPAPRIGLVWAGEPRPDDAESSRIDRRRSLCFDALQPLLARPSVTFVSLQKGSAAAQLVPQANLLDPSAELRDFADTAALIANLDLVVTVDTAVAHLAGALGKKTFILSRFDACWRWQGNQTTSPWYPSVRVFGQSAPGDWDAVIAAVQAALVATA